MPLLHGSINHFLSNALPFFCLMQVLIFLMGWDNAFILALEIHLLSSILLWLMGRNSLHIGASAMISGLFGWIVFWSFQNPTPLSLIIVMFTLLYFGTIFIGILPLDESTSWEGHLFGLITGFFLACYPQFIEVFSVFIIDMQDRIRLFSDDIFIHTV
jgi:membrane associated rhomboid family serine protease